MILEKQVKQVEQDKHLKIQFKHIGVFYDLFLRKEHTMTVSIS